MAHFDVVERVEHGDRVGQLVTDRVGVAAKRIERGVLDPGGELAGLLLEPVGVRGPGPARDDVQQPRVQCSVLVAGQVHHAGHGAILVPDPGRTPDVLIHPQRPHAAEAARVGDPPARLGLDGVPAGMPVHPEVAR